MKKIFAATLCVLFLTTASSRADDDYAHNLAIATTDILIARPFTFAASLLGGALWAVSLPITIPTQTSGAALDAMVKKPWQLTFDRQLGDFR